MGRVLLKTFGILSDYFVYASLVGSFFIPVYQSIRVLIGEKWSFVSVIDGLIFLNLSWAERPSSYFELHEFFNETRLSPFLFCLGISLFLIFYFIGRRLDETGKTVSWKGDSDNLQ